MAIKDKTNMADPNIAKFAMEDIKASVEKTHARLIFLAVVLFMGLIAYSIRACDQHVDNSVSCVKAGGIWVPEEYRVINGSTVTIGNYCNRK